MNNLKIKKNDKVVVLSGKDKGKTGKVLGTVPSERKVVVEGINTVTCHIKPRKAKRAASSSARRLSTPARSRWSAPSATSPPAWPMRSRTARKSACASTAAPLCKKGESK